MNLNPLDMDASIAVSVVIVVSPNRGEDSIWETLASFPTGSALPFELIAVDPFEVERAARYQAEFPWVRVKVCGRGTSIPEGRNLAIGGARGIILAFADDHIRFPEDYLEVLVRAFDQGADVVGGSVRNANPGTSGSWAHYFAEYSKWLPGIAEPDWMDLPGSNWAMRRSVYDEMGGFAAGAYGLETELFLDLRKRGKRIVHEPALTIGHIHETRIVDFWPISFRYGVAYAKGLRLSRWMHGLRALSWPLVGMVLLKRSYEKASQLGEYRTKFWEVCPQLGVTFLVRAMGEAWGHLQKLA